MQLITTSIRSLRESPFNYRKDFNPAKLAELALSITAIGIEQPIKVRELPKAQQDIWLRYEIIFGHRRFRAAKQAGLEEVPVLLVDMTDEQVKLAQLAENLQREDVNPIEEAEGFDRLLRDHGLSVESLVKETGKSRTHIYNRMRLLNLSPEAREACATGLIGGEIATLIATVPEKLQKVALSRIIVNEDGAKVAVSYRRAKSLMKGELFTPIASAVFPIDDADLCKMRGACTTCPKLSQNDPGLCGELDSDVCIDFECFTGKVRAHGVRMALQFSEAGKTVMSGEGADKIDPTGTGSWFIGHSKIDEPIESSGKLKSQTVREAIASMKAAGVEAPEVVLHISEKTGKPTELLRYEDQRKVREFLSPPKAESSDGVGSHERKGVELVTLTPLESMLCNVTSWEGIKTQIQQAALQAPRDADDLRLIAASMLGWADVPTILVQHFGWTELVSDIPSYLVAPWVINSQLSSMSADDLAKFVLVLAIEDAPHGTDHSRRAQAQYKLALAKRFGVSIDEPSEPSDRDINAEAVARFNEDEGQDQDEVA